MASKEDISGAPLSVRAVFLRPDELHMWALGVKSLIFCDNRLVLSHPEVRILGGAHTRRRGSRARLGGRSGRGEYLHVRPAEGAWSLSSCRRVVNGSL